jgi:hypothetical protein
MAARDTVAQPREARPAPAPATPAPAAKQPLLALQRSAGNAAVGAYLRQTRARHLARCGGGHCGCAACSGGTAQGVDEDALRDQLGRV